ncbi:hypothetical protein niasHT_029838 [Heterodera trifolii]|uniref:BHLH domain-containing protein n=1 Tax=Heterodera trifolii TaxID=157864 RepID=A0ABD2K0R1_9BILA
MLDEQCTSSNTTTTIAGIKRAHGGTTSSISSNSRSTRGASKQRRDQINLELAQIRHLLPLAESTKERLFQLQVMALCCVWIRKYHALHGTILPSPKPKVPSVPNHLTASLSDLLHDRFLLVATDQGKLITLSDNFHSDPTFSTDEFVAQGDSLYDLIDPRDHQTLAQALSEAQNAKPAVAFRQSDWDGKPSLLVGKFTAAGKTMAQLATAPKGVFTALCRPLRSTVFTTVRDAAAAAAGRITVGDERSTDPDTFRLWLSPALQIVQQCTNAEYHLSRLTQSDGTSSDWPSLYQLIHPNCASTLATIHKKLLNHNRHHQHHPISNSNCGEVPACAVADQPKQLKPVLLELIPAAASSISSQCRQNVNDNDGKMPSSQPLRVHAVFGLCHNQTGTNHQQKQEDKHGSNNQQQNQVIIEAVFQVLSDLEADAAQKADWLYSETADQSNADKKCHQRRFRSNCLTTDQPMVSPPVKIYFPAPAGIIVPQLASQQQHHQKRFISHCYAVGCHQNWHHYQQQQLAQYQQQQRLTPRNCYDAGDDGTKFLGDKPLMLAQPLQKKRTDWHQQPVDLNNNCVVMPATAADLVDGVPDADHGDDDDQDSFLQLPSLCDGHQLPELDDRDLDEFFRQVEQGQHGRHNNNSSEVGQVSSSSRDKQQQQQLLNHGQQQDELISRRRKRKKEEEEEDGILLLGNVGTK